MITYIPHLITLVLCIGILVLASINLRLTCRNVQESLLRILIFMALGWQTVVILFFMYNQTLWVIKEHDTTVGTVNSVLWLMYDYANNFFHLSSGLILYHYLKGINTQRSTEETIISKWHCPVVDTKELDKAKAELDKLSQRIIPITDITDVEGK